MSDAHVGEAERQDPEFYVGYLPNAPPLLARRTRRIVTLLVAGALLLAFALATSHRRLAQATFEFGVRRDFEGILQSRPCPSLMVRRAGAEGAAERFSRYLLVCPGKHGAEQVARQWSGRSVKLNGSLVFREGLTMLEMVPESLHLLDPEIHHPEIEEQHLGVQTLIGEIVDSKCFLGVMNPGHLKTHRDCAVRCISGGIPPVLCVRDERGHAIYLLLVDASGAPVNDRVLPWVAEPVQISGELVRMGDWWVMYCDPETYRRP